MQTVARSPIKEGKLALYHRHAEPTLSEAAQSRLVDLEGSRMSEKDNSRRSKKQFIK